MEIDLDTGKLVVFVAGLALFLTIETLAPARGWTQARWRRIGFHGAIAALNTVLIRLFVYVPFLLWIVYVEQQGWGLSRLLGLTGWIEIVLSVVMLDAFDYFWHRANHRVTFLWRFHKAHHADTSMDTTTSLRFHPGELIISGAAKALWVLVWGPTATAWFPLRGVGEPLFAVPSLEHRLPGPDRSRPVSCSRDPALSCHAPRGGPALGRPQLLHHPVDLGSTLRQRRAP